MQNKSEQVIKRSFSFCFGLRVFGRCDNISNRHFDYILYHFSLVPHFPYSVLYDYIKRLITYHIKAKLVAKPYGGYSEGYFPLLVLTYFDGN